MKNWLIKLLGGFTIDEMLAEKKERLQFAETSLKQLRVIADKMGVSL